MKVHISYLTETLILIQSTIKFLRNCIHVLSIMTSELNYCLMDYKPGMLTVNKPYENGTKCK